VIECYARGLSSRTFHEGMRSSPADRAIDMLAGGGRIGLALADTYARFFAPAGRFRRRMVLLSAILESSPVTAHAFEPPATGPIRTWVSLMLAGLGFGLRLLTAFLVLGPLHLGVLASRTNAHDARPRSADATGNGR